MSNIPYRKFYKLEPCPLCKGAARMIRRRPLTIKGEDKHVSYVKCSECYARSGFTVLEDFNCYETAWDIVAEKWNSRPRPWAGWEAWTPVAEGLPDTPHEQTVETDFDEYALDHYSEEVQIYDEIEGVVRGRLYLEGSNNRPLWADVDGTPLLKVTHWAPLLGKPE